MPPEVVEQLPTWANTLKDLGLVGWLILSLLAIVFGVLITKASHDAAIAALMQRLQYVEDRRKEERQGRVEAERRVAELVDRMDRALTLMASIERELIRSGSRGDK